MAQPQSLSAAKIALYAIGTLAVIGVLYIASQQMFAEKSLPLTLRQASVEPIDLTKFPKHFYRMRSNGCMSNISGREFCVIEQSFPSPKDCDELTEKAVETLRKRYPDYFKSVMEEVGKEDKLGILIEYSESNDWIDKVVIGADPKDTTNFNEALSFVEKKVLKDPQAFFSQNSPSIRETLVKTHQKLLKGKLDVHGESIAGSYRTGITQVSSHHGDLRKHLEENGGMAEIEKLFEEVKKRIPEKLLQNFDRTDEWFRELTDVEKEIYQKYVAYIPPLPEHIPHLMVSLAKNLTVLGNEILRRERDAVDAASTIHCAIGNIQPFVDGNGRLARLWMNILLMIGGKPAVVFPDDAAYTEAIIQEQAGIVGAFSEFLKKVIQWNERFKIHTHLRA